MKKLILTRPVSIQGPDFWGRESEITFSPIDRSGWWWDIGYGVIPITPDCVYKEAIRLQLRRNGQKMEIFEHFGALRFFGLDGVVIKSNPWPPYFGSMAAVWESLIEPYCEVTSEDIQWFTVKDRVAWEYPKPRNGHTGFTAIFPSDTPRLDLDVVYSYRPYGEQSFQACLPDRRALNEVCAYPPPGIHKATYSVAKIASQIWWPNFHKVTWPQELTPEEAMKRFVLHRTEDLLGALSLLCGRGLLAGRVVSLHSGHEADLNVARMALPILRPI